VPSSAWLADVLAAPLLASAPDVAEAAFSGEHVALLVPAGSVPGGPSPLRLDAEGRVGGRVLRVLGAADATQYVAVAGPEGGRPELRLVRADDARVERRDLLDRSRSVADVVLEDPPSVALEGDVDALLGEVARRAAVLVAADALGAMQRMLDLAVEYSKQRHQFGVPIGSFQAVKHAAATMLVDVEAARSAVYFAAASVDAAHPEADLHAAAVKAQVTAAGSRAADSALTLHGAIGYTWEHDLHFFYKRARLDEALFGSPHAWNERIADALPLIPAQPASA
jgi:alkylation response protein AidB-like acyl-CoA dehydrogenase